MDFIQQIKKNNANNLVNKTELDLLISQVPKLEKVWFERSVFINWTCAIADCKYCYLSTKPKHNPLSDIKAIRSKESILAEILMCKIMGWEVGYITGGLRVESADYLVELLKDINLLLGHKIMMNFGPYSKRIIDKFAPYVSGMGSAIESFDEELHNFICPSKPLKSLMRFLGDLENEKLITIILGLGEKKSDVDVVIENVKKYGITKVQLCFLKPQENTVFSEVPSPNMNYMAWWAAKLRLGCPNIVIKVALVKDRIEDFSLLLNAGVNAFSRFMVFNDFAGDFAFKLEHECKKAGRDLMGSFTKLPNFPVVCLPFDNEKNGKIMEKFTQYWVKLEKLNS